MGSRQCLTSVRYAKFADPESPGFSPNELQAVEVRFDDDGWKPRSILESQELASQTTGNSTKKNVIR